MVNEIILDRQTYILISDNLEGTSVGLYPRDDLYPSDDPNNMIYPSGVISVSNSIVEGSMSLDEIISDNDIDLGKLCSTKFECDLYNVDSTLQGKFIQVFQTSEDGSSVLTFPVFLGYIDSCTSDRLGTDYHLIAYDLAYYYGGIDISSIWNRYMSATEQIITDNGRFPTISYTTNPQQGRYLYYLRVNWNVFLKNVLDELGIEYDFNFSLETGISGYFTATHNYNPSTQRHSFTDIFFRLSVNKTVQKMTLADLITSICQLAKVIPHFGKDGVFRTISISTSSSAISNATDLTENYEKENLNISQLIRPPFDDINYKYKVYRGDIVGVRETRTETLYTDRNNKYEITNNILLLLAGVLVTNNAFIISGYWSSVYHSSTDMRSTIMGALYTYLHNLKYYVGSAALIVSDVNDLLGALIKVQTDSGLIYYPVMKTSYTGTQLINQTVEASGTLPTVDETKAIDYSGESTETQVDNMQTQVNEVDTRVATVENNLGILHWESVADNQSVGNSSLTKVGEFTLDAGTYVLDLVGAFSASTSSSGYRRMYIASSTSTSPLGYIYQDQRSPISSSDIETVLRISCTIVPTATTTYHVYMVQTNGNSSSLTANVRLQTLRIK